MIFGYFPLTMWLIFISAIMRYMGDLPMGLHQREVECVYTILVVRPKKIDFVIFVFRKYKKYILNVVILTHNTKWTN